MDNLWYVVRKKGCVIRKTITIGFTGLSMKETQHICTNAIHISGFFHVCFFFSCRIPSFREQAWIVKNCRKAWDEFQGYKRNLWLPLKPSKYRQETFKVRDAGKRFTDVIFQLAPDLLSKE